jgi:hypothetical protein
VLLKDFQIKGHPRAEREHPAPIQVVSKPCAGECVEQICTSRSTPPLNFYLICQEYALSSSLISFFFFLGFKVARTLTFNKNVPLQHN